MNTQERLEEAQRTVRNWPEWKQTCLGYAALDKFEIDLDKIFAAYKTLAEFDELLMSRVNLFQDGALVEVPKDVVTKLKKLGMKNTEIVISHFGKDVPD